MSEGYGGKDYVSKLLPSEVWDYFATHVSMLQGAGRGGEGGEEKEKRAGNRSRRREEVLEETTQATGGVAEWNC